MHRQIILAGIIILSMGISNNLSVPKYLDGWTVLQKSDVWVGWVMRNEIQWCKAEKSLPFTIDKIAMLIEDKENYPDIFKRIEESKILTHDIVHISLDMPFPFSGRDYIVKYVTEKTDNDYIYTFTTSNEIVVPERENYVRLVRAGGRWRLSKIDDKNTKVSYTWNGELRGDFPNWGLERAWKTQGTEVLNWLNEALKNKESSNAKF